MAKQYKGSKHGLFFTPDEALCEWLYHAQFNFEHSEWHDLLYVLRHPANLGKGIITRHDAVIELLKMGQCYARMCDYFPNMPKHDDDGGDDTDTENRHIQPHTVGMVKKWYDFTHDDHKKKNDDDV